MAVLPARVMEVISSRPMRFSLEHRVNYVVDAFRHQVMHLL